MPVQCVMKKLIKLRTGFPSPWGHVLQMKHDWKLYKRRNYIEDWNKITMLYSYTFLITNTCWYYYGDYSNTHKLSKYKCILLLCIALYDELRAIFFFTYFGWWIKILVKTQWISSKYCKPSLNSVAGRSCRTTELGE